MKTVADIEATIERRLARTWHADIGEVATNWPYRILLGQPSSVELEGDFPDWSREVATIRDWAFRHDVTVDARDRRVHGTTQPIPTAVTVEDIGTAAKISGPEWSERITRNTTRIGQLRGRFGDCDEHPRVLRLTDRYSDLDFELLLDVSTWFQDNDAAGMTPRQVPVPGVHAKWLNTHGPAIEALIRRPLELARRHPARIHFTYLDPNHLAGGGRRHDSASVGDTMVPAYRPTVVIIVENKDTAIHFPEVQGGIAVEGDGFGGATAATFPWLAQAPRLFYWGDIDADGFEILDGYRRAGLDVTSILMDLDAYHRYAAWGTTTFPNGEAIPRRAPKALSDLTAAERAAYDAVCQPADGSPRRIEQERIPLEEGAARLRS